MTSNLKELFYTWGFVVIGILCILGGFSTIASESSETIWIGGIIGGGLFIIYGFINFGKVATAKQEQKKVVSELESAIKLFDAKEYKNAQILLDKSLNSGNLNAKGKMMVRSLRARCLFHQDEFNEAYTDILFISQNPSLYKTEIEDYILKFLCEMNLEKREEAKTTLEEALDRFPNNPKLQLFLSQMTLGN